MAANSFGNIPALTVGVVNALSAATATRTGSGITTEKIQVTQLGVGPNSDTTCNALITTNRVRVLNVKSESEAAPALSSADADNGRHFYVVDAKTFSPEQAEEFYHDPNVFGATVLYANNGTDALLQLAEQLRLRPFDHVHFVTPVDEASGHMLINGEVLTSENFKDSGVRFDGMDVSFYGCSTDSKLADVASHALGAKSACFSDDKTGNPLQHPGADFDLEVCAEKPGLRGSLLKGRSVPEVVQRLLTAEGVHLGARSAQNSRSISKHDHPTVLSTTALAPKEDVIDLRDHLAHNPLTIEEATAVLADLSEKLNQHTLNDMSDILELLRLNPEAYEPTSIETYKALNAQLINWLEACDIILSNPEISIELEYLAIDTQVDLEPIQKKLAEMSTESVKLKALAEEHVEALLLKIEAEVAPEATAKSMGYGIIVGEAIHQLSQCIGDSLTAKSQVEMVSSWISGVKKAGKRSKPTDNTPVRLPIDLHEKSKGLPPELYARNLQYYQQIMAHSRPEKRPELLAAFEEAVRQQTTLSGYATQMIGGVSAVVAYPVMRAMGCSKTSFSQTLKQSTYAVVAGSIKASVHINTLPPPSQWPIKASLRSSLTAAAGYTPQILSRAKATFLAAIPMVAPQAKIFYGHLVQALNQGAEKPFTSAQYYSALMLGGLLWRGFEARKAKDGAFNDIIKAAAPVILAQVMKYVVATLVGGPLGTLCTMMSEASLLNAVLSVGMGLLETLYSLCHSKALRKKLDACTSDTQRVQLLTQSFGKEAASTLGSGGFTPLERLASILTKKLTAVAAKIISPEEKLDLQLKLDEMPMALGCMAQQYKLKKATVKGNWLDYEKGVVLNNILLNAALGEEGFCPTIFAGAELVKGTRRPALLPHYDLSTGRHGLLMFSITPEEGVKYRYINPLIKASNGSLPEGKDGEALLKALKTLAETYTSDKLICAVQKHTPEALPTEQRDIAGGYLCATYAMKCVQTGRITDTLSCGAKKLQSMIELMLANRLAAKTKLAEMKDGSTLSQRAQLFMSKMIAQFTLTLSAKQKQTLTRQYKNYVCGILEPVDAARQQRAIALFAEVEREVFGRTYGNLPNNPAFPALPEAPSLLARVASAVFSTPFGTPSDETLYAERSAEIKEKALALCVKSSPAPTAPKNPELSLLADRALAACTDDSPGKTLMSQGKAFIRALKEHFAIPLSPAQEAIIRNLYMAYVCGHSTQESQLFADLEYQLWGKTFGNITQQDLPTVKPAAQQSYLSGSYWRYWLQSPVTAVSAQKDLFELCGRYREDLTIGSDHFIKPILTGLVGVDKMDSIPIAHTRMNTLEDMQRLIEQAQKGQPVLALREDQTRNHHYLLQFIAVEGKVRMNIIDTAVAGPYSQKDYRELTQWGVKAGAEVHYQDPPQVESRGNGAAEALCVAVSLVQTDKMPSPETLTGQVNRVAIDWDIISQAAATPPDSPTSVTELKLQEGTFGFFAGGKGAPQAPGDLEYLLEV